MLRNLAAAAQGSQRFFLRFPFNEKGLTILKPRHLIFLLCLCCILTGCSLLPPEPTIRNTPLIQDQELPTYDLVQVTRGNLRLEHIIGVEYISTKTKSLRFSVADVPYVDIYVKKGDTVKAGQLLAQLDMQGYDIQLAEYELELQSLELDLTALEENRALALARKRLQLADRPDAEITEACNQIHAQYDRQKQTLLDEKYILQMQHQQCKEQVEQRKLFAPMDGIVSFAVAMEYGMVSKTTSDVVRIKDPSVAAFRANTRQWHAFQPGDTFSIQYYTSSLQPDGTIQSLLNSLDAVVVTETQLGLNETSKEDGFEARVYLQPADPSLEISEGQPYFISLLESSREDVLILPRKAVFYADKRPIVYCLDENNMRYYKYVELGLVTNDSVEIVSGLAEGDYVIQ